ncbi:MAG: protoporphyrinogen oxidase [Planctomycetota bacterium]
MSPRVAVIGGGLSGLTVAFSLGKLLDPTRITLFESSPGLGGVIGSERVSTSCGDFVLDLGADMFATDPPAAMDLCRELGLESRLLTPRTDLAGAMIVRDGRLERIPEGFVLARATRLGPILKSSILSWPGKLRFLLERWRSRSAATTVDAPEDVDESVADFVRHRMGNEVLQRLAGPLVAGIYTADIERLSLRATLGPIAAMVAKHGSLAKAAKERRATEQSDRASAGARYQRFRGLPGGTGELIDRLGESIREAGTTIRTDTLVQSIRRDGDQWRVAISVDGQSTDRESAGGPSENGGQLVDEVVFATPARVSAALLRSIRVAEDADDESMVEPLQAAAGGLESIESSSAAIVVLAVRTTQIARLPQAFGIVVPEIEGRDIIAISFASHKYDGRCPTDHTIIRVFLGGAKRGDLLQRDDDELIDLVRAELRDLIGLGEGQATLSRVVRWQESMPQYHVGHVSRVQQITKAMHQLPGLSLTTNALHGVGIAPVIREARRTAHEVHERWAHKKAGGT